MTVTLLELPWIVVLSSLLPLVHFLLHLMDISQWSRRSPPAAVPLRATAVHSHFPIPAIQHECKLPQIKAMKLQKMLITWTIDRILLLFSWTLKRPGWLLGPANIIISWWQCDTPGTSVHDLQNYTNGIQDQGPERLNDVSVTVHPTAACDPQWSTDHGDTVLPDMCT